MERRAQFTPSSGSFRFEFRLSRFERSGGLELISRGEFEEDAELARARLRSLRNALASIWRIRSRVRAKVRPTSSDKLSDMQRVDERTYGKLIEGINTTAIEKNERLKVSKFYVYPDYIEFLLTATEAGHMRDIDAAKANTEQYGNTRAFHDFALVFRFHFDKEGVMKAGNYQAVVSEIRKYLLPQDEAEAAITAEKNIELEIGMPEENVIQRMEQPIRSMKVGDQRFLKYKEMTVVIKDGKVAEVKVE